MGLEDFMDIEGGDESSSVSHSSNTSSSNDSDSESKLLDRDGWVKGDNGKPKRRGPYGYSDESELEDTVGGELQKHGNMFKYHLPIFPHITRKPDYRRGKRYNMPKSFTTLTCVSQTQTELGSINREMVMLDCGTTEKEECVATLGERFGEDVDPTTEVCLHIFAKMRHVVKMAMGGEFVDNWSLENKDRVLKAVYGESYTQQFREKDTGENDLKHLDHIDEW